MLSIILVAACCLQSCSPFSKVYSEEEPGVNLYRYHTYQWSETKTTKQGNQGPEWLTAGTQSKIRSSVETQLERYGFQPCTEKPDLVLHYHVVIKNEILYVHDWTCTGQSEAQNQYDKCNRVRPVYYQEGTLLLDMIDPKNSTQVWRGAVVGMLNNLKPEAVNQQIDAAIAAMFKKFPEKPIPTAIP